VNVNRIKKKQKPMGREEKKEMGREGKNVTNYTELSPFLRSYQLRSYSRISKHFIKPESSLPSSQEPYTGRILSQINAVNTTPF
jgi:hypothetical protein